MGWTAMLDNHWLWQRDYVIPSKSDEGRLVVDEVLGQLKRRQWGERDLFGIHLALEEALTNAIKHGNRFDTRKRVQVQCRIAANLVRLEVSDEGSGFDPAQVPDPTSPGQVDLPSGRGIMLMRHFMSRVEYNTLGNRVILEKDRAAVEPQE